MKLRALSVILYYFKIYYRLSENILELFLLYVYTSASNMSFVN